MQMDTKTKTALGISLGALALIGVGLMTEKGREFGTKAVAKSNELATKVILKCAEWSTTIKSKVKK